jgi:hypothetical protein
MLREDGTPWLSGLTHGAPRLDMSNLEQRAALPLNSHLRVDPWDDKVVQLNLKADRLLNPGDKMPFEVTPIFYRLEAYQAPAQPVPTSAPAPGAAPGADSQPAAGPTGAEGESSNAPAETTITPAPPATPATPQANPPVPQPQAAPATPQAKPSPGTPASQPEQSNEPTEGTSNPPPVTPQL